MAKQEIIKGLCTHINRENGQCNLLQGLRELAAKNNGNNLDKTPIDSKLDTLIVQKKIAAVFYGRGAHFEPRVLLCKFYSTGRGIIERIAKAQRNGGCQHYESPES